MKRIAFYGGSFDPPHNGHLTIAEKLTEVFELDEFVFIPAFHAPHKKDKKPTAALHRFAMLCLATANEDKIKVSKIELDAPERPFTFETQLKLKDALPGAEIFFVIGADSWNEIDTWREWQRVLTLTNIIIVTRPNYEIVFSHVTDEICQRIVDLRKAENCPLMNTDENGLKIKDRRPQTENQKIYITDAVNIDVSATEIRRRIRASEMDWLKDVPQEVAKYIEKYDIY